jgi:23S rRNA (guanine2445-N2)-methyltransferase
MNVWKTKNDADVTTFLYQKNRTFFAQIANPIEELGAEELRELGATSVEPRYRGISFEASDAALYNVVYRSRLCNRILAPLIRFDCHSDRYLYKTASSIDWSLFLDEHSSFAITATVSQSWIDHSQYAALRLKDAIVDYFREKTGSRPSIDKRNPDLWLSLHIQNNKATISVDVAGGSLHRRGYKQATVEASMQETVAAAIIRMTGWEGETPLIDPMCGSGTILSEALMHICRIPSAYFREKFGFMKLPDYDADQFNRIRESADARIRPVPETASISGSDISDEAIDATRANLRVIPHSDSIELRTINYQKTGPIKDSTIVLNPPYGLRLRTDTDIANFYKEFGDFLKQECSGSKCYLYAGKRELLKNVGLRTSWKKPLVNGALDGRLAMFDLY